ncbi:MAG: 30S ribosomal protein S1 [Ardenticatenaceae bacterium]|nr:30S ribosomal protein S1 [Anaerolineales bacterium]MCB8921764.1 30S ribosomal protein S1 [Ardenticatenaceae bacterium]MCB8990717.1 30S ribosomal protein S1 [Ardenticatenaceae bacterium]
MDFLLEQEFNLPTSGEIRQGWIVEKRPHELLVDIGAKSEGLIPNQEYDKLDQAVRDDFTVGEEITVFVVNPEDANGNVIVSYTKAAEEEDWKLAQNYLAEKKAYTGTILGFNRGGVILRMGQLRAFIPNSQLDSSRFPDRTINPERLQKMVGKKLTAKVLEVDRQRGRLIMSERAASRERRESQRQELLDKIKPDDIVDGRVINLTGYGAFVDIGGIEGLVHLSELSWKRVKTPADILKVGDEIKVAVLSIDPEQQRIALSMKQLETDPWTVIESLYTEGQLIEAIITKLTKFGAFARINDDYELEGLIHVSELAEGHVNHPREIVKPDDTVTVRIIRIAADQRQLGLSLKQVDSIKYLETDMAMLASN